VLDELDHFRSEDVRMLRLLSPACIDALDAELRSHRNLDGPHGVALMASSILSMLSG
jgi:hypothetical protein